MTERKNTYADGSDFETTEYQDNFRDKFWYVSDVEELEEVVAGIQAGTLVAQPIKMAPGEYALTQTLAVSSKLMSGVELMGDGGEVVILGPDDAQAILIHFAAAHLTSTFELRFKDVVVAGQGEFDAVHVDNTDAGKKINVYFDGACCEAEEGKALKVTHGDASNAVRVYCTPGFETSWDGGIYFAGNNDGDRFRAFGHNFEESEFESNDQATLAEFTFVSCMLTHEGIVGGNAAQQVNLVSCYTIGSGVMALADANDVAGDQTLNISPPVA